MEKVPPGIYQLNLFAIKYAKTVIMNLEVKAGIVTRFDYEMLPRNPEIAKMLFVPAEVDTVDADTLY